MPTALRSGLITFVLALALVVGVVVLVSTAVVRTTILDQRTYTAVLYETGAYDRVYTEVLADPELAAVVEQLLGEVAFGPNTALQARALATSTLRLGLPPATLQHETEAAIESTLAYIRGDTDQLRVEVAVDEVFTSIETAASARLSSVLADTGLDRMIDDPATFEAEVVSFLDDLTRGVVPDRVPRLGPASYDVARVTDALAGPLEGRVDPEHLVRIESLLLAGNDREAIIAAASAAAATHTKQVATDLRDRVERVDITAALGERARGGAAAIDDSLAGPRRVASWFGPLTSVLGALVVVVSAAGLVWQHRRRPDQAMLVVGLAALVGGSATIVLWWVLAGVVAEPLDRAASTGPDGWNLPPSIVGLVGDVRAGVGDTVASQLLWRAAIPLLIGSVLLGAAVIVPRLAAIGDLAARRTTLGAAGVVAGVIVIGLILGTPDPTDAEIVACNGHPELCDRPYDEVVQAATHNSMSSPDIVQVWPEHDGDMRSQLDFGVRALLIDTHYWTPVDSAARLVEVSPDLPPVVAEAVLSTAGPLAEGRDGTYLCHNHCVFGGIDLIDGLGQITGFLEDNPGEVVTLIVQDAISVEDTEAAFDAAGLEPFLFTHDPDESWPTLREMIDAGERLVVFAEEEGPPPAWYANAFESMQETPFLALTPEALSCRPNRGDPEATLFLMNHWVQRVAPDRADSVTINQREFIVERARECEAERGLLPNFVAVNFYSLGDVMGAVDELNGVG